MQTLKMKDFGVGPDAPNCFIVSNEGGLTQLWRLLEFIKV
jgi:hypothetical protein